MKRIISVLLVFVLSVTGLTVFATDEAVVNTEDLTVKYNKSLTEYAEYIKAQERKSAGKEITIPVNKDFESEPLTVGFDVKERGCYTLGLSYRATDLSTSPLCIGIKLDEKYPFDEAAELSYPKMWVDESEPETDSAGNTYASQQKIFGGFRLNNAIDISGKSSDEYVVYLTEGKHTVTIIPVEGTFELESIVLGVAEENNEFSIPTDKSKYYSGEPIVYEAENAYIKSSNWLIGQSDLFSSSVTPNSPTRSLINYIGGSNWKTAGETISWNINVPQSGYYSLGYSFRQNTILNSNTYRHLKIDGTTPFKEAEQIPFGYDTDWQYAVWSDENRNPYLVYLSKGKHELSLTVTSGEMKNVISLVGDLTNEIGDLYRDIIMITGDSVDTYRDYDLFVQIPDMKVRLEKILDGLNEVNKLLEGITGHESGSYTSVFNNMIQIVEKMLQNKYIAHRYKDSYYSSYSSISASLLDMTSMPLDLDKIILYSPNEKNLLKKDGFFSSLWFSTCRFFSSFVNDYNAVDIKNGETETVTVWVGWGRDQAQVLKGLLKRDFTPKANIAVDLKIVNASVVQALLSGNGPDCILQHSRTEPVNLAMRGALYDISAFSDCDEVLKRFADGADIPYRYKGGLYALPDTQTFYMMYYRTDVFSELGLSVPKTWEDFKDVSKLLIKNNLSVWMPYTQITDMSMVNSGIGTLSLFPTFMLQNGLSIYEENGRKTTLSNPETISVFQEYTDFYTKLRLPVSMSFYNRFRSGTTPLGIDSYTLYTTITVAAPEIDGRWAMAEIPGTVRNDGTVSHTSSAGGTACAILSTSSNKDAAWELLKWWTSADTQLSFSNNVESVLGPTGRIAVSNTEALSNMSWDSEMKSEIFKARENVQEIPEYPGSYYVSRSTDHSFWNVVNSNKTPKDMLTTWGSEADDEIARKWAQYEE